MKSEWFEIVVSGVAALAVASQGFIFAFLGRPHSGSVSDRTNYELVAY